MRIGSDLYKDAHPAYRALLERDVGTAGAGVRADVRHCQAVVEEHARARRLDVLVETALADVGEARAQAAVYRAVGFRVEVVAVAVPLAVSQLNVLHRYLAPAGNGPRRWVSWANHDECAQQLARALDMLEVERLVDRITVVQRDIDLITHGLRGRQVCRQSTKTVRSHLPRGGGSRAGRAP